MFDWQTIAVFLLILAAFAYAARRGLSRLRSFNPSRNGSAPGCATGCGVCGEAKDKAPPAPRLVQISASGSIPRRTPR
jgi:hypothetical protein